MKLGSNHRGQGIIETRASHGLNIDGEHSKKNKYTTSDFFFYLNFVREKVKEQTAKEKKKQSKFLMQELCNPSSQ